MIRIVRSNRSACVFMRRRPAPATGRRARWPGLVAQRRPALLQEAEGGVERLEGAAEQIPLQLALALEDRVHRLLQSRSRSVPGISGIASDRRGDRRLGPGSGSGAGSGAGGAGAARLRCGSHSSQRGRYQFQSPSSFIVAGSSTARTIVASTGRRPRGRRPSS